MSLLRGFYARLYCVNSNLGNLSFKQLVYSFQKQSLTKAVSKNFLQMIFLFYEVFTFSENAEGTKA